MWSASSRWILFGATTTMMMMMMVGRETATAFCHGYPPLRSNCVDIRANRFRRLQSLPLSSSSSLPTVEQKKNNNIKSKTKNKGGSNSKNIRSGDFWEAILDPKLVWRPTVNDVERISWGKPAKKKGTGSRGVPHRLNQDERRSFEQARRKGFLEIAGSGWRSERRDAPLYNTYRSLCDARGQPSIVLHKQSNTDGIDVLVVDISPLRTPHLFESIAQHCLSNVQSNGKIVFQGSSKNDRGSDDEDRGPLSVSDNKDDDESRSATAATSLMNNHQEEDLSWTLSIVERMGEIKQQEQDYEENSNGDDADDEDFDDFDPVENYDEDIFSSDLFYTRPIYQLPPYRITWELQRSDAKTLAKTMAELFDTQEDGKAGPSKKPIGVKPGKSRRHGGYGIG